MNMVRELLGATALVAAFALLLAAAELWSRKLAPDPEHTRKLVHLGGGLLCLLLPLCVESLWLAALLLAPLAAIFWLGGRLGALTCLHRVQRKSRGSEYYPLAVLLVFAMSGGRTWMYVAALLSLAVADAFAALVGTRYGVLRYEVEDESKSLEGSLVFMVLAFLAIELPVLLMTDLDKSVVVLTALLAAMLLTGFEAVSLRGADNIFVPVAVCVILAKNVYDPAAEVAYQVASLAVIALVVGFWAAKRRSFNWGGKIAFILFAYGVWALGSWHYGLPVFIGFFCVLLMGGWLPPPEGHVPGTKVRVLSRILLPSLLLVVLANALDRYDLFFGPFLGVGVAVLGLSLWSWVRWRKELGPGRRALGALLAGLAAWAALVLPQWLMLPVHAAAPLVLAALGPAVVLIDELCLGRDPDLSPEGLWRTRRFVAFLAVAGIVLTLQAWNVVGPWALPN